MELFCFICERGLGATKGQSLYVFVCIRLYWCSADTGMVMAIALLQTRVGVGTYCDMHFGLYVHASLFDNS